ncbi:MAG TPA: hypothetical protein VGX16_01345 [Solirubrobacteraceae bacterium]|nr:hypothetical protein [Solirubrobacteraceae bacterium]
MSGCGGSQPATQSTAANVVSANTARPAVTTTAASEEKGLIALSSPALYGSESAPGQILARYTCHGANISPPLHWGDVPHATKEFLLVLAYQDSHGDLHAAWAVAGLKPALHALAAGQLPQRAVVGKNDHGQQRYSLCLAKGKHRYLMLLMALPHQLHAKPGFNAIKTALEAQSTALAQGRISFWYPR